MWDLVESMLLLFSSFRESLILMKAFWEKKEKSDFNFGKALSVEVPDGNSYY